MESALQVLELGPLNSTHLSSILGTWFMFERDWVWILINMSFHGQFFGPYTKNVKEFLRENELAFIFLSQYVPDMAPVELFFDQLKRMIWGKRSNSIVNLKKNSGKQILAEVVKFIDRVSVMKILQHFVSVLKQLVGEIDSD